MMSKKIELIVEGVGDVQALPVLVERILRAHNIFDVQVAQPVHRRGEIRTVRTRFNEFFRIAAYHGRPVLCVLDFDCDDCHDALGEEREFLRMAQAIRPQYPFQACFLVKEYESLFLWDLEATKTVFPLIKSDYVFPDNPELIRDAKGELSKAQPVGYSYKPTAHQEQLSRKVSLELLREKSASFQRLEQAVLALAQGLRQSA
jgi:Domain of unknown function (DUF4276)